MAISKRRHGNPACVPPDRPDTIIGLLWELAGDRERARCFIAIVTITITVCCFSVAGVLCVALIAANRIKGSASGYILPAGFFAAPLATWITIMIKKLLKGSRDGAANVGKQTGKH
jgi:hypothetical protein